MKADGTILACSSSGFEDIWKRSSTDPTSIYYADGNVGIGIASPLHMLDVNGNGNFTGGTLQFGTAAHQLKGSDNDIALTNSGGGSFLFQQGGNNSMVIAPNGHVGVGTNTPQTHLHVNRNTAGQGYITFTDDGDAGGQISMGDGTSSAARMTPTLWGQPKGEDRSLSIIGQITSG